MFNKKLFILKKRHLSKIEHVSCLIKQLYQYRFWPMKLWKDAPFPVHFPLFSVERNRREAALNWLDSRHDQAAKVLETEFPPGVLDGQGDNLAFVVLIMFYFHFDHTSMSHQQKLVVWEFGVFFPSCFHLPCDIGARDDVCIFLLNEELKNPRILKITG